MKRLKNVYKSLGNNLNDGIFYPVANIYILFIGSIFYNKETKNNKRRKSGIVKIRKKGNL